MVRLADPVVLRAHQALFDPAALRAHALDPVSGRHLDALLERPYEDLSGDDAVRALALTDVAGLPPTLFAYFLPALLRRPPMRDRRASERLLQGLLVARGEPALAPWGPEIEETLVRWLAARPLRGGDDPVDLWLSEPALRRLEVAATRRHAEGPRARTGVAVDWTRTLEAPVYARAALVLFQRFPAAAERRFLMWEAAPDDNAARAWVETMFHVHGEGWRPEPAALDALLDEPARLSAAEALIAHPEPDVAIGAAAVGAVLAPRRWKEWRLRIGSRLRALDAADQDRFVLVPTVRRLLAP